MAVYRRAFSLIELAFVLAFVGVIAGLALKFGGVSSSKDCYATTRAQLNDMRDAVERFAMSNDRFPMPARRNVGVESPSYGREARIGELDVVGTTGGGAVFGALPFQALHLPVANAADCWGNKLTYVVTRDLTDPTRFLNTATEGGLSINTSNTQAFLPGAGYAIISHGEDQLGAVKNNYEAPYDVVSTRQWCAASATQLRTQNCDIENNMLISAPFNNGADAGDQYFDDVIVYRGKPWRNMAIDGVCGASMNLCNPGTPANSSPGLCNGTDRWQCVGSGGGATASCAVVNPPCEPSGNADPITSCGGRGFQWSVGGQHCEGSAFSAPMGSTVTVYDFRGAVGQASAHCSPGVNGAPPAWDAPIAISCVNGREAPPVVICPNRGFSWASADGKATCGGDAQNMPAGSTAQIYDTGYNNSSGSAMVSCQADGSWVLSNTTCRYSGYGQQYGDH